MGKKLTEKQQAFLDHLFTDEVKGNVQKAKELAGYHPTYSSNLLVESVKDELIEQTNSYLARVAPKAAFKMEGVLDHPSNIGNKEVIAAAKDLLDRAGYAKTEKIDVTSSSGLFVLPPKKEEEDAL